MQNLFIVEKLRQANVNSSGDSIAVSLELVLAYLDACGKTEADLIPFIFQTMTANANPDIIQELRVFVDDVKPRRFFIFVRFKNCNPLSFID